MANRRFNEEEVAAIFERATEAPTLNPHQLTSGEGEGMTLAELQAIGREVGAATSDGRWRRSPPGRPSSRARSMFSVGQRTTRGDLMDEKSLFTKFWTNESKTTHKVLTRIPDESVYRPDPKSRTAQEIAWQIVCEEKMIIEALENGKAEWAPPPMPPSMKKVLAEYEKQSAGIAKRWKALPAARWDGNVEFFGSERPGSPMAWSFLFDIVHHRGQITTYLRPMGSKVPQIYGPSGDEP